MAAMIPRTCTKCNIEKDKLKDFYKGTKSKNPMKLCKECYNRKCYGEVKRNFGFSRLPEDVKTTIVDLFDEYYKKESSITKIIATLKTQYPNHDLNYGKVHAWHMKNQIPRKNLV